MGALVLAAQAALQFGIKPAIRWGIRTVVWCAANLWFFVAVTLLLIFSYERNGVVYNEIPMGVREFLVALVPGTGVTGLDLLLVGILAVVLLSLTLAAARTIGALGSAVRHGGSAAVVAAVVVGDRLVRPTFVIPDGMTCLALVTQSGVQFVITPIVRTLRGLVHWCTRNAWLLFAVTMVLVLDLAHMGLFAETMPAAITTLMTVTLVIGPWSLTVAEVFLLYILITVVVFVYAFIQPTLQALADRILQIGSTVVLIGLLVYSKLTGRWIDEFVVLEGRFTLTDVFKFALLIGAFVAFIGGYYCLQDGRDMQLSDAYFETMTDANGDLIPDEDLTINFSINLTTEPYGERVVSVTQHLDYLFAHINAYAGDLYEVYHYRGDLSLR
ncbi:MAG: hypothetical protein PHR28_10915 [candidate division Zixibacteria bacterium]|nr:hypothetical protein [candidate division Zixibacteria bacterium]